ncbi:MAG: ATP-dependent helicase C-terminal domain-containing protein, partial [Gemmatimonas sp.]
IEAANFGQSRLGAEIAALLEERDIVRGEGGAYIAELPCDLRLRVEALRDRAIPLAIDRDALFRIRRNATELQRRLGENGSQRVRSPSNQQKAGDELAECGALLALAFPDRIARRRGGNEARFLLRNGTGAVVPRHDGLASSEWLAIAELDGTAPDYRVVRAAPVSRDDIDELFRSQYVRDEAVEWHDDTASVSGMRRTTLGALVIEEAVVNNVDPAKVRDALLARVQSVGLGALPWTNGATALRGRLTFLHHHDASWPDVTNVALAASLHDWLGPLALGMRKWADLERVDWTGALMSLLPWEKRSALDRLAPSHLEVPSGSRIAVDYDDPDAPVLAVKLQEVFGWTSTPMLLNDRVAVTLKLLSPAGRPVQVTRDLEGFWRTSYFEVRKEMRGRYPRPPWPDDPLSAPATRRAKPRG